MAFLHSIFGLCALIFIAFLFSENKKTIPFKTIFIAFFLHILLACVFLKLPVFKEFFLLLNDIVLAVEKSTTQGTTFVFGYLGGGDFPFEVKNPQYSFILAFKALPIILVISALSALLYYYRILPIVVMFFSWLLQKSLHIRGIVGLSVAANAFVGMVEAPLFVRPYLKNMTRGEIFSVMVAGMSTIAGTVMVLYAHILSPKIPDAMGHILTASVLNVFSSLIMSLLIVPHQITMQDIRVILPKTADSGMDALVKGTTDGVKLLINIIAMLIVLVSLVSLVNQILAFLPEIQGKIITLQSVLGIILSPLTFLLGIPLEEMITAGSLMGTKIVLNELIAYIDLLNLSEGELSSRSQIIMIYAMCGFANIGSLGIMLGGMTVMVPEKRNEILSLGMKSVFAGVLATCLTGTVVGLIFLF